MPNNPIGMTAGARAVDVGKHPMTVPLGRSPRLEAIDLLRFFAASAVMVFHLGYWSWAKPTSMAGDILSGTGASYPALVWVSWWGWVGVPIFFVISGFVIAFSASSATARTFAAGRFLRLAPGIWICATITAGACSLLGWAPANGVLDAYWRAITLWPGTGWIDSVYWTLGVEIAFYSLVFTLLLSRRVLFIEVLGAGMLLASATWTCLRLAGIALPSRLTNLLLLDHGMYFSLGIFLWAASTRGYNPTRAVLTGISVLIGIIPIVLEAVEKTAEGPAEEGQIAVPVVIWLLSVFIVALAKRASAPLAAHRRASSWIARVGLSTYALYLLHDVVGAGLIQQLILAGSDQYVALLLSIVAMAGLGFLVTLCLEPPVRRFLKARISDK